MSPRSVGYFRVVANNPPTPEDFRTDREAGMLNQPSMDLDGRSVFSTLEEAISLARRMRGSRTRRGLPDQPLKVAQVLVDPDAGPFRVEQRGRSPLHFQPWGEKAALAAVSEVLWEDR